MAPRAPPFSRSIARLFRVSSVASRAACLAPEILTSLDLVVERKHRLRRPPVTITSATDRASSPVTAPIIPLYGGEDSRLLVRKIAPRWRPSGGQPRYRHREIVSNVSDQWIEPIPSFLSRLYMSALVARRFNATYPKQISYAISIH